MATQQDTSIETELGQLTEQILNLFFLSEGDCTQTQLDDLSEQLTRLQRYARAMGYHAAITCDGGGVGIEWQSLQAGAR
jgi:hypothetical protein